MKDELKEKLRREQREEDEIYTIVKVRIGTRIFVSVKRSKSGGIFDKRIIFWKVFSEVEICVIVVEKRQNEREIKKGLLGILESCGLL